MNDNKAVSITKLKDNTINSESQDSVLNFALKLQNQMTIDSLMQTFEECIRSIHCISGVRYRFPLLGISNQVGNLNTQRHQWHVETKNEFLGDMTVYHDKNISAAALHSFELISSLMIHPLRSIIQEKANSAIACTEELTGIANPYFVEQMVTREAKLSYRERVPMSLVLIDIDRFARVTAASGLIHGDTILYQVMHVIRDHIRNTDLLFRYEEDTYCLILKGVSPENAFEISERIRIAIDNFSFTVSNKLCHITVSSGIAKLETEDNIESLFTRTTNAMLHAKKMGRNQSIIADGTFITSGKIS